MPSGSKKRKAARKKQENQSVSTHSNGDDDVKHQDDKDSDVGELSSPNSHDHHSHQSFSEGEEEEIEKGKNISSAHAEEASKSKDSEEPSTVAEDDSVVPVDREFEIEGKSSKKDDGSSYARSNSSRSSSDDESHRIKNSEAAIDTAPDVDSGNRDESKSGVPAEIDNGVDSVEETFPAEELKNTSNLGEKEETDTSVPPSIIEPVGSEEKSLSLVEDNGISTASMDMPLKTKDGSTENIGISDLKECVIQESHDREAAEIGVELENDSGDTGVYLVPAPHPVQPTTWKSCCGLFEVFAGSRR